MDAAAKKKLKWLFNQPEEIILQAIKLQRDMYFKLKAENKDIGPDRLTLLSLTKAAEFFYNAEYPTSSKNPERNLNLLKQKVLDRIQRHEIRHNEKKASQKRESKKKKKIIELTTEIKIMREQGQSFQSIANYIENYHKTKLHPTYISKLFHKGKVTEND